jgi:hypothetical protein
MFHSDLSRHISWHKILHRKKGMGSISSNRFVQSSRRKKREEASSECGALLDRLKWSLQKTTIKMSHTLAAEDSNTQALQVLNALYVNQADIQRAQCAGSTYGRWFIGFIRLGFESLPEELKNTRMSEIAGKSKPLLLVEFHNILCVICNGLSGKRTPVFRKSHKT